MRPSARERGYGTAWEKARKGYLRAHPHCTMCMRLGKATQAVVVDHIKRHRSDDGASDQILFWDKSNWQSLCKPHHDSTKQLIEKGRVVRLIGDDGWPVSIEN